MKLFTPEDSWFTLVLPEDWDEYDSEEEGTYAFFNSKSWTGNFRITPFLNTSPENQDKDMAAETIAEELAENEGAKKINIGNFDAVQYKEDIEEGEDAYVIYYWMAGKGNYLFACSFTIDKEQENTKQTQEELELVQNIIGSIKITL